MATAAEIRQQKIQSGEITDFFDCLADILLKYSDGNLVNSANFKKCFSSYMLCRYLSMKTSLIEYAEYFNKLQSTLTQEQMFLLAYKVIPKQSSGYIPYVKKGTTEEKELNKINNNIFKSVLFEL